MLLTMILAADTEPTAVYEATLAKKDDTFKATMEKGAAVWTIASNSGIGSATVKLAKGDAPKKVLLLFPGLKNMEQFKATFGGSSVTMKVGEGSKSADRSISVEKGKDGIEVRIYHRDSVKEVKLSWIDAFRK